MTWTKRLTALALAGAFAVAGIVGPAGAATTPAHWSKTKCTAYVKKWDKAHKKATSAQKKKADKVLKKHGCTEKVK